MRHLRACCFFLLLAGCQTSAPGWHYENSADPERITYLGILDACRYQASIMSDRGWLSDRPLPVSDWDEDVRSCMLRHGWTYVDH